MCSNQVQSLMIYNTTVEDNVAKDSNFSRESSGYGGGFFIKISGNNQGVSILNITDSTAKRNTGNRGGGFLRVEVKNEAMLKYSYQEQYFYGKSSTIWLWWSNIIRLEDSIYPSI